MWRLSEVQLLVLLSFILQLFLFFTGGLRRRKRNWLLRGTIWLAYLAADVVAIYTLGFLSRQADAMHNDDDTSSSLRLAHPLAFLWAPFLLIHLGGQDTITAFAIEDNNLWLRHLLNLLLQVTLALYVFWKSSSWHSTPVLVPGILLFVAGIIKYGERAAALKHGNLNSTVISCSSSRRNNNNNNSGQHHQQNDGPFGSALRSALGIRMLFARRKTLKVAMDLMEMSPSCYDSQGLFKLMDVELGMVYSDIYTKAAVLRTKRGIVFRCISLSCTVAALVLFFFFTNNTTTYSTGGSRVDTVITYTLFVGGLVVDMCSLLTMVIASPWTWAWLRAQDHHRMASMCLRLISCCDMVSSGWLGTTTTRPFWSNTMGQYRFVCYDNDDLQPRTLSEQVMCIIRKLLCNEAEEKKLFWLSKLLEIKHVAVDDNVTKCLVEAVNGILMQSSEVQQQQHHHGKGEQWPKLGQLLLAATQPECTKDFVRLICWLHACTEVLLCEAAAQAAATTGISNADAANADICRKLSRYMTYLVAVHPAGASLLQMVSSDPDKEYRSWERYSNITLRGKEHQVRVGLLRLELEAANRGCGCGGASSSSSSSSGNIVNTNRGGGCGCGGAGASSSSSSGNIVNTNRGGGCGCGGASSSSCSSSGNIVNDNRGGGGGCCCCCCATSRSWSASRIMASSMPHPVKWRGTLEELKHMWARLLVYAAANSRPEAHAAELARGGELLTFVWLLLSHEGLGSDFQVDLVPRKSKHHSSSESSSSASKTYYVFKNLPAVQMLVDNCCPQILLPPPHQPNINSNANTCSRIPPPVTASRADP